MPSDIAEASDNLFAEVGVIHRPIAIIEAPLHVSLIDLAAWQAFVLVAGYVIILQERPGGIDVRAVLLDCSLALSAVQVEFYPAFHLGIGQLDISAGLVPVELISPVSQRIVTLAKAQLDRKRVKFRIRRPDLLVLLSRWVPDTVDRQEALRQMVCVRIKLARRIPHFVHALMR